MKKLLTTLATVGTIAIASMAAPTSASAQWRHHGGWGGGAVAAGVVGGLALGAIAANSYPYYGGYGYGYAPAYAYGPGGCYLQRERFWDGWGWRIRRVRVCY